MAAEHYENFPVASLLLPRHLRHPIAAIYAFARSADDFADEGNLTADERLNLLRSYQRELVAIAEDQPTTHPVFLRLRPVIARYGLPLPLFHDLLEAFMQDVTCNRYASYAELIDYCRRSANPVGRLLLHLFAAATEENILHADAICSALQLINHWQDVGIDSRKGKEGRIYLPAEDMVRFNVSANDILRRITSAGFYALMRFQVDRARALMQQGAPLGRRLPGRIGLEIRTIIASGLRILEKIEAANYDVFNHRPQLQALDWPLIGWRALFHCHDA
ncbi:phytoene synthase [Rugosibacter aromaticivorans]|uniref:Phytoene synthase n=1 Tax=Rugosibacter aromaticivorans TaxID=1565605 RepID=A0A0C5J0A9_9PROT|nr:squalene synthase HpnC [Rugosibacter aromaticivorans]AJP48487.1 phytoene synthase [Rugosibacter aromaticivorans]TBR15366.1 MAG: squalene synthase HpnC [Rugosibacter sp.]